MYAELFGKVTGYCKGKGGSMHICDLELGMLGANGIVGRRLPDRGRCRVRQQVPQHATRSRSASSATVPANEGTFHEAANMAALYRLPVVFVCENNLYGEFTPQAASPGHHRHRRSGRGYGMPGVIVDGMDALAVYEAAGEAIARARRGDGPTLLECKTYRFYRPRRRHGHGRPLPRTDAEVDSVEGATIRSPRSSRSSRSSACCRSRRDRPRCTREVLDEIARGDRVRRGQPAAGRRPRSLMTMYSNPIRSGRLT